MSLYEDGLVKTDTQVNVTCRQRAGLRQLQARMAENCPQPEELRGHGPGPALGPLGEPGPADTSVLVVLSSEL